MANLGITWENLPSTNTPITAENLNQMQENLQENIDNFGNNFNEKIGELSELHTTDKLNLVNAINETVDYNTYSTNEKIVGKWINNKPIYQKVLEITTSSTLNQFNNIYEANIDDVISMDCQYQNGREKYPENFQDFKFYVRDGILKEYHTNAYYSNHLLIVIIKYTKTTD